MTTRRKLAAVGIAIAIAVIAVALRVSRDPSAPAPAPSSTASDDRASEPIAAVTRHHPRALASGVEPYPELGTDGISTDDPLTEDYAVIALVKGLEPSQSVLILAGDTTIGTQAAVEYVCNKNAIEQLLLRLSVSQAGQLKPFEALIRVKVTRGVPVSTELVAIHSAI